MKKTLKYDNSLMFKEKAGISGISRSRFKSLQTKVKKAHKKTHEILESDDHGFITGLNDRAMAREIAKYSKEIRKNFKQLLLIGIGGSDLGARALQDLFQNKVNGPEIFFLGDTTDPAEIKQVLSKVDLKKCAINVISKSGNTVEVLSVFLYIRDLLIKAVGKEKHAERIYATTENNDGALKQMADLHGYTLIKHPENIGGRWSVLSVVGLLSAAVSGLSYAGLRKGGRELYQAYKRSAKNPAAVYAAMHYLEFEQGLSNAVLMPYASNFDAFGAWYRQLFGESLGKNNKGLTPLVSVGPRDQHSQIQLYNEGPADKIVTFLRVKKDAHGLNVPRTLSREDKVQYLSGWNLHDILNIEQQATAQALAKNGRPNGTIVFDELTEYSAGQLFMFFELACVYIAQLMKINAFNQPGVEEGKKIMNKKLRRS